MTVNVTRDAINVREKLAELDKPTGIAGEAMLRAETPQEQFNLIGAGRRNLLINGAMQHWQRGTGPQTVGSGGDYLPDRFQFWNSTGGAYTFERSTDTPNGFAYSTKLQVTTADTSLGSAEYSIFAQHLEVQDCLSARMGYSDAQELTLSFWVKSSKTGTYSVTLHKTEGTDYFCHRTFNINSADTWEHISFTYPPNTLSGISADGTGTGFRVVCWLAAGSAFNSSGTEGQWSTSSNRYASDKNVNWMDSTSNNFYITGVQLELGKVATPFEHRSYGEELALCSRFFEAYSGSASSGYMPMGMAWTTNEPRFDIRYLEKRVAPTISLKSGSTLKSYNAGSGTEHTWSNFNVDDATTKTALIYGNNSMAATQGYAIQTRLIGNIFIDAEL